MVYTALNGPIYLTKLITRGRIVPDDEDDREYWTRKLLTSIIHTSTNNSQ
jgi:AGZA family xanthine/uracil permease-like MFS transporter